MANLRPSEAQKRVTPTQKSILRNAAASAGDTVCVVSDPTSYMTARTLETVAAFLYCGAVYNPFKFFCSSYHFKNYYRNGENGKCGWIREVLWLERWTVRNLCDEGGRCRVVSKRAVEGGLDTKPWGG